MSYITDRDLVIARDGSGRLLAQHEPQNGFLLAGAGCEVSDADCRRYRLGPYADVPTEAEATEALAGDEPETETETEPVAVEEPGGQGEGEPVAEPEVRRVPRQRTRK